MTDIEIVSWPGGIYDYQAAAEWLLGARTSTGRTGGVLPESRWVPDVGFWVTRGPDGGWRMVAPSVMFCQATEALRRVRMIRTARGRQTLSPMCLTYTRVCRIMSSARRQWCVSPEDDTSEWPAMPAAWSPRLATLARR